MFLPRRAFPLSRAGLQGEDCHFGSAQLIGSHRATTAGGEVPSTATKGKTLRDLAPTSPRSAVPPARPPGFRYRASGFANSAEGNANLKEVAGARASRVYGRNSRPRSVKAERGCWESVGALHVGLAMALLSLALVTLLAVFHATATSPVEAATKGKEVTYGSVIKLQHERTKYRLHSHEVPYGSGSGQQSVTAFPGVEDGNSYWMVQIVEPSDDDSDHEQGEVIPNGSIVRLQHVRTRKWLHSHLHQSPISGNLEVSAFGGDDQTDTGDYWKLEIEGKGNIWMQDQKVRLRHVDTNGYLHSHDKKYSRIVAGQQEVCGMLKKNADNIWTAAEGIYFQARGSSVV
ncbi:hypothetical protein KC19_4G252500 [Ceratodon purpureus]|uniref:MIR domain-containing protein n=1 Tax=Ceratodon purpureus TaxID=3225 RepID=A0A8T0IEY9_CERPU|nr:hypothetical protein KC19_4G252500 [Ceratodon purpureus]